jgi:hypothetical protein
VFRARINIDEVNAEITTVMSYFNAASTVAGTIGEGPKNQVRSFPLSSVFVGVFVDTDLLIVFPLTFFCVSVCIYVGA